MKSINIFTLVLAGSRLPLVAKTILEARRKAEFLPIPLKIRWVICEGVAEPEEGSWKNPVPRWAWKRNSRGELVGAFDSDWQWYNDLEVEDRPFVIRSRAPFSGKTVMCNLCLERLLEEGMEVGSTLIQIDSDEVWRPESLLMIHDLWTEFPQTNEARFYCNYHITASKSLVRGEKGTWANHQEHDWMEWIRAWKWVDGKNRFLRHAHPILEGVTGVVDQEQTFRRGLFFDHHAFVDVREGLFKSDYYNQTNFWSLHKTIENSSTPSKTPPGLFMDGSEVVYTNILSPNSWDCVPLHLIYGLGLVDHLLALGLVRFLSRRRPVVVYCDPVDYDDVKGLYDKGRVTVRAARDLYEAYDFAVKSSGEDSVCCFGRWDCLKKERDDPSLLLDPSLYRSFGAGEQWIYNNTPAEWSVSSEYRSFYDSVLKLKPFVVLDDRGVGGRKLYDRVVELSGTSNVVRYIRGVPLGVWGSIIRESAGVHGVFSTVIALVRAFSCSFRGLPVFWHKHAEKNELSHPPPSWVKVVC